MYHSYVCVLLTTYELGRAGEQGRGEGEDLSLEVLRDTTASSVLNPGGKKKSLLAGREKLRGEEPVEVSAVRGRGVAGGERAWLGDSR